MNQPLSVYELIANASLLVQGVMVILVLASVVSWMMILQRWSLLRRAKQEIDAFEDHFWSGIDLRGLYQDLSQEEQLNGIEEIFVAGFREYTRLSEQPGVDAEAIMQGTQRAMRVITWPAPFTHLKRGVDEREIRVRSLLRWLPAAALLVVGCPALREHGGRQAGADDEVLL